MNQLAGLRELVGEMYAGTVEFLLILGGNPVYTAPADLDFAAAMERVPLRAHLSLYEDETSALCHWHVPETHFLEAWSDVRSDDGTATIIQPLIAPLYNGKSAHEVVAAIADRERSGTRSCASSGRARGGCRCRRRPRPPLRRCPGCRRPPPPRPRPERSRPPRGTAPPPIAAAPVPQLSPFDREWRKWLHDGLVPDTAFTTRTVSVQGESAPGTGGPQPAEGLEVVFRPGPGIHDGRFANNAWLQELPKPLTKLTWDNAALISPATAARLALISGDVVELRQGDRSIRIPVWLAPGHAPDTLTLHLGYGRTRAGRAGNGTGFNVNPLRTTAAHGHAAGRAAFQDRRDATSSRPRRITGRSKDAT